jgi:DNA-binding transcriptional ArsR family regulator
MKRDMDLARAILFDVEKRGAISGVLEISVAEDYQPEEIEYHIMLLAEAGLIKAREPQSQAMHWRPIRLTWEGHEFLDAARDPGIWAHAQGAAATVGGVGFQLLMPLLIEFAKGQLRAAGFLP